MLGHHDSPLIFVYWNFLFSLECYLQVHILSLSFFFSFYPILNLIKRGKTLSPTYKDKTKKCVLISGCDTGFGNLLARRLDEMGYEVIAGEAKEEEEARRD